MAAVPITLVGTITTSAPKGGEVSSGGTEQCVITGIASITDLSVGGGPMPPQQPPGIWPSPGHPEHPIAPGGPPPGIWPSPGHPEHPIAPTPPTEIWPKPGVPTHPIVIPQPPTGPEAPPEGVKPPPPDGGWGFHPDYGWGYFPPGGKPQPGA
jgi:hypothetical protein